MLNKLTGNKRYTLLIEIALVILVLILVRLWNQRDMVSGVAPDIHAPLLSGESFHLHSHARKPLLLHFWGSWCPVCRMEESSIQSLSEDYEVITVALQSGSDQEIRKYLADNALNFAVINDDDGVLALRYGIKGVPASFIIDQHNQLRFVETGYTTETGLRMRLWWTD